jgi:hypothetical protein
MQSYVMPLVLCLACSTTDAQRAFEIVPSPEVNESQKALAQQVAHDALSAWKTGRFQPLGAQWTAKMKSALPPATQRQAYAQMKILFGDYSSMTFAEAQRSKSGPALTVYRFRGSFSQATDRPEIRVVIDASGKVAGFWVKPWLRIMQ